MIIVQPGGVKTDMLGTVVDKMAYKETKSLFSKEQKVLDELT